MKTFPFLTLCLLLCSCSVEQPKQEFFTADVQSIQQGKGCLLEDVFSDIQYVPLEDSEESQVGYISRILKANDNSLVVWDNQTNRVLRFDAKGKFLNQIGAIGHAKNEYNIIDNIAYNPYTNQVWVADLFTAINIYELDGTFVRRMEIAEGLTNIGFVDADHYCLYGAALTNEHFYAIYNVQDNKEVFKFCPRQGRDLIIETGGAPIFRYHNGRLVAHTKYADTAYLVDSTSFQPLCQVNYLGCEKFKKGFNPEELLKQNSQDDLVLSCYDLALTDKYLFSVITIPELPRYRVKLSVNILKTGQQFYLPTCGDEKLKFCPFTAQMLYVDNQQFISTCGENSFAVACKLLTATQDTLCAEYSLYQQFAKHENPVLIVATLK
ncbi:MAG: 6-bladed beta-propeller [Bacteroidales bacterium]|nr:6-bladed beta-propeller [Bacteroidales bacterium]